MRTAEIRADGVAETAVLATRYGGWGVAVWTLVEAVRAVEAIGAVEAIRPVEALASRVERLGIELGSIGTVGTTGKATTRGSSSKSRSVDGPVESRRTEARVSGSGGSPARTESTIAGHGGGGPERRPIPGWWD